jgi:surface protein
MFQENTAFNQNIGSWNTGAVTKMYLMFDGATGFNQDIGSWNTAAVSDMRWMFRGATAFNQNISNWCVQTHFNLEPSDFKVGANDTWANDTSKQPDWDAASCPLLIGDTHQGGIIFYLDGHGGGLIAAPTDQSNNSAWGCFGTSIVTGSGIVTGAQNTINIEAGCTTSGTAADICANLTLGGYSDWFLPSKDELNQMYLNIGGGSGASGLGNVGNFSTNFYWSSTEYDYNSAWKQDFDDGFQYFPGKDFTYYVRAVRAF